jgi:hypothetical protein
MEVNATKLTKENLAMKCFFKNVAGADYCVPIFIYLAFLLYGLGQHYQGSNAPLISCAALSNVNS